jgi:ring-1,2-phenylacetyl-CoA epoxidase subunit PaaD
MGEIIRESDIFHLLDSVSDPELPVLSILDLGIVRSVDRITMENGEGRWRIVVTPTYSGCPAMDMISMQIRMTLYGAGITDFEIVTRLSPAWTTDWMTESGKAKLKAYGIAPPHHSGVQTPVECPHCGSSHTQCLSEFGSTACKALYRCEDCREPFDHFKCH